MSLFVILTVIFAITYVIPGNAANIILGQAATEDSIALVESQLGLDQPLHVQYINWLTGIATGDWGESYLSDKPVTEMVVAPLIRTLQLAVVTIIAIVAIAIPFGVYAAANRDTWIDSVIRMVNYCGVSVPSFVSGTLLLLIFAGPTLGLLPSGGYTPLREGVFAWASHLVLPVISMTIVSTAHIMRQTRSEMIDVLQSDYVRLAHLKGMPERKVLFKHALRNGLLPAITVIALNFGALVGGLVITETIFSYPGIGRLLIRAISNRDIPLLQIAIIIPTTGYILGNLLADLMYSYLDPRVEFGDQ